MPRFIGGLLSVENKIIIKGAREHTLKSINLEIPKNKLVVFTGVSGSGKSSLAFDTIYAEGQRRYVESLSTYARQFLGIMDKPDVDSIEGLSPSISISQKAVSHNPRSTVGTITEIYDYLRLLFARIGHPHCPNCAQEIKKQDTDQIVNAIQKKITAETQTLPGKKAGRWLILSPVIRDKKGEFTQLFSDLESKGYTQVRIDNRFYNLNEELLLIKTNRHNIDTVIDRMTINKKTNSNQYRSRLFEAVEQALELSDGLVILCQVIDKTFQFPQKPEKTSDNIFSERFACSSCNISIAEIEPRLFSFNTPNGACKTCNGLGTTLKVDPKLVLNDNLSISEGAITPLSSHFIKDTWLSRLILAVSRENNIPTKIPLSELDLQKKNILLFGTNKQIYEVKGTNRYGRETTIYESFPGIIPILEKRYTKTKSEFLREQVERYMRKEQCVSCKGARLKPEALAITIQNRNIAKIADMSISNAKTFIGRIKLSKREEKIGLPIIKEIKTRLNFLISVGLDYLTLSREASTLAGGEAQRIMLASQIGSGLTGVLYVLDEPSIGLHQRDNKRLIHTLKKLRDLGNTVIVVEHDQETIENADYIVDFGPGGGKHGGKIVVEGTLEQIKKNKHSLTGDYLSGRKTIKTKSPKPKAQNNNQITNYKLQITNNNILKIKGCSQYNLKNIDVEFPLGKLICITGVSGSGKSTLIVETLYKALKLNFNPIYKEKPGKFKDISGYESLKSVQLIDQSPIGRTPRSNPATYTKAFDIIRDIYANTKQSRLLGYKKGRFSFNVKGGRCEACEGQGENKIEMQFMSDIYVTCEVCRGKRYNSQTLEVTYKEKNIADILSMPVEEACRFFANIPNLNRKLKTLDKVGLSYIELGQPAPLLSGGEAQRVKLASELSKHAKGQTLYILDEPTTGLHFHDLKKLLKVLQELVNKGNTVIIIEHNLDVIKNADWIIDLGPEGGEGGGEIVATGTPSDIVKIEKSYTGKFLKSKDLK